MHFLIAYIVLVPPSTVCSKVDPTHRVQHTSTQYTGEHYQYDPGW